MQCHEEKTLNRDKFVFLTLTLVVMWYKLSKPDGKCRHQFPGYLVYQRLSCVLFDRLTGFLPSNRFYCRPNVHPNRSLRVLYLILGRLSFYCFILYLSSFPYKLYYTHFPQTYSRSNNVSKG